MATFPASFSTPTLYKLIFLSPNKPATRIKCSLSKSSNFESRNSIKILRTRIRAVQREESVVLEEGDNEIITKLNGSVNGSANGNYGYGNGSVEKSTNGSLKIESQNGSLAKYANGNGNGSVAVNTGKEMVEVVKVKEGIKKNKSVEEIGQEDAWFKQIAQDQVEVCDLPFDSILFSLVVNENYLVRYSMKILYFFGLDTKL